MMFVFESFPGGEPVLSPSDAGGGPRSREIPDGLGLPGPGPLSPKRRPGRPENIFSRGSKKA